MTNLHSTFTVGPMLIEAFRETQRLTIRDMQHKTIFELLASGGEELGELSRELKIEHRTFGNAHKKPDEGPKAEAVDLAIVALAIFYAEGGTHDEFAELMFKKLKKWDSNAKAPT
jgi:hypothetical protein